MGWHIFALPLLWSFPGKIVARSSPVHLCCKGTTLRLGLLPSSVDPFWEYKNGTFSGAVVEAFLTITADMGIIGDVHPVPLLPNQKLTKADFEQHQFDVTIADVAAADVWTHPGVEDTLFTEPVLDAFYEVAVLQEVGRGTVFTLFEPFQTDLWLANSAVIMASALLLIIFNAIAPNAELSELSLMERVSPNTVLLSFYHMFSFQLGGEQYEWTTGPSRILRLGLLLVLLVSSASYTANLAAFFTKPNLVRRGPRDLTELRHARACTVWDFDVAKMGGFASSVISAEVTARSASERRSFCINKLKEREVDAIIASSFEAKKMVKENCASLALSSNMRLGASTPAFVLSASAGMELVHNISAAVVHAKQTEIYTRLKAHYFLEGSQLGTCIATTAADTTPLSLESQWGLFYIYIFFASVGLIIAIVQGLIAMRTDKTAISDGENDLQAGRSRRPHHTMTEGELLRLLLRKVDAVTNQCAPATHSSVLPDPGKEAAVKRINVAAVANDGD